jgi:hypothetical protein
MKFLFKFLFAAFLFSNLCLHTVHLRKLSGSNKSRANTVVVPIYAKGAYSYAFKINVGTPGQTLEMMFDTGSCTMVLGNCTPSSGVTCAASMYDPTKSTSFTTTKLPNASLSYGTGAPGTNSAANVGPMVIDKVTTTDGNASVEKMQFASIPNGNTFLIGACSDYSKYNALSKSNNAVSYVTSLKDAGLISSQIFSVNFNVSSGKGQFTFGSYDSSRNVVFMPNAATDYGWRLIPSSVNGLPLPSSITFTVDAGGASIGLPQALLDSQPTILNTFGTGCKRDPTSFHVSCQSTDGFSLTVTVNGNNLTLPASSWSTCDLKKKTCSTNIKFIQNGKGNLGFPFLKYFYWVLDMDAQRIGFAGVDGSSTVTAGTTNSRLHFIQKNILKLNN